MGFVNGYDGMTMVVITSISWDITTATMVLSYKVGAPTVVSPMNTLVVSIMKHTFRIV